MRDEGESYAQALRRAGVATRYTCHAGMIHYFYAMAGAIPAARTALKAAAAAMRHALVSGEKTAEAVGGASMAPHNAK